MVIFIFTAVLHLRARNGPSLEHYYSGIPVATGVTPSDSDRPSSFVEPVAYDAIRSWYRGIVRRHGVIGGRPAGGALVLALVLPVADDPVVRMTG